LEIDSVEIIKINPNHHDERGIISDVLVHEEIEHVTIITSHKGVERGNHFHKETIQWAYLYSGRLEAITQENEEDVVVSILEPGDLIKTDKLEKHALYALEDSVFFVFTKGPRGGQNYEEDTYRLTEPLRNSINKK
jgi:hypothetical protein